jgi:hypothetical protein
MAVTQGGNAMGMTHAAEPTVLKMTPEMLKEMEASIGGMAIVACALWFTLVMHGIAWMYGWSWIIAITLHASVALSYNLYVLAYWVKLHARFKTKVQLMS